MEFDKIHGAELMLATQARAIGGVGNMTEIPCRV
jgi:hypothetical protein